MELKDILLVEKHPITGLDVVRQFIGIAGADKEQEVIQLSYYEFQLGKDGNSYEITRKKKVYSLIGSFFQSWYTFSIEQIHVGSQLGRDLIEGNVEMTLLQLPIDCEDGYTITVSE